MSMPSASPIGDHFVKAGRSFFLRQLFYAFVLPLFVQRKDGRTNAFGSSGTEHAETARPDDLGFHKVSMPSASPIGDHFVKSWSQFLLRQLPYAFVRLSFVFSEKTAGRTFGSSGPSTRRRRGPMILAFGCQSEYAERVADRRSLMAFQSE